jgi:mannose-6-phosphate isomerase-like protein (cupin superfamily)
MAIVIRPEDRELAPLDAAHPEGIWMQYIQTDAPYVHMTRTPPGHHIALHSHSEDEVTVILSGRARVGDGSECGAGTVLLIPANEKYALTAGEAEPLVFLVVRPRRAAYELAR